MRTKRRMMFAGALAAMLVSSSVQATQGETVDSATRANSNSVTYTSSCITQWESSEAYDHCSATVSYTTVTMGGTSTPSRRCELNGSCSITVDVDDTSTTFTPSVDVTARPNDLDDYDICFAEDSTATSGFSATVKDGCASTETDSDDATSNGLSSS